ncbi:MmcQ/YjbR family DNA-binding protein [Streptococcus marmotae]|uniref:MmcQ/YjbR family DNA-binding protein n=1 Tax=Streptococcus marmotae TaxID=1825069 RepID=UPI00082C0505|nr:MmcQ/YjbR family DNA-binding protein [Streptococcus marmotae]
MLFEDAFFKNQIWQQDRLVAYGFQEKDGWWTVHQPFMNGHFEARIRVKVPNQVVAQVWDIDMDEEYHAFRIQRAVGAFVGEVRENYAALLHEIVQQCAEEEPFQSPQGNRLIRYIQKRFQEEPDYPFTKAPDIATLRHAGNQKWYGLMTQVPWTVLKRTDKEGKIDIINVKVEADQIEDIVGRGGIYPAYHMSKKSWVSISLDDSLSDEDLFALVEKSRQLVAPKSAQSLTETCYWILPANPALYDIDTELRNEGEILWTQKPNIKRDDIVCIYMTKPIQAIRYLCRVSKAHLTEGDEVYMKLELLRELSDSEFPLLRMKDLGVKAVRGPRLATPECRKVLESLLKE